MRRTFATAALMLGLSGCVATGRLPQPAAGAPPLDPIAFFAGRTLGEGLLVIATRRPRPVTVAGSGRIGADGAITLDQVVTMAGAAPAQRQWTLRHDGAGGFSGALTDATGPVSGRIEAGRLHLRFTLKGGLKAEQFLAPDADGRTVRNVMILRKWGLPVARLDEVITRVAE